MNRKVLIQAGIITICMALLYGRVIEKLVYDWIHLPDFSHKILPRLTVLAQELLESRADVIEVSLFGSLARG